MVIINFDNVDSDSASPHVVGVCHLIRKKSNLLLFNVYIVIEATGSMVIYTYIWANNEHLPGVFLSLLGMYRLIIASNLSTVQCLVPRSCLGHVLSYVQYFFLIVIVMCYDSPKFECMT